MLIKDLTLRGDDPVLEIFQAMVKCEQLRRENEDQIRQKTLVEFEKSYSGFEVGYARRSINSTVNNFFNNAADKTLLDYGCGGSWWKDTYWPLFKRVMAVEINQEALKDLQLNYKGSNVDLVLTQNGLINTEERFDYILSSSVVGYIHPRQAEYHLKSCFDLLKDGGTFVFSRVKAFNIKNWLEGTRLRSSSYFSFSYSYSRKELWQLLINTGFREISYHDTGIWLPFGHQLNQFMFKHCPKLMQKWLPHILPFLKFQHMFTAKR